jgi:hypothetical protein
VGADQQCVRNTLTSESSSINLCVAEADTTIQTPSADAGVEATRFERQEVRLRGLRGNRSWRRASDREPEDRGLARDYGTERGAGDSESPLPPFAKGGEHRAEGELQAE